MKGLNVVVVDDDLAMQKLLAAFLEMRGCNIETFTRGVEAVRYIEEKSNIDLVITDIFMPEMDGIELVTTVKRINSMIRIIAISSGGELNYKNVTDIAVKLGADAKLNKPFMLDELVQTYYDHCFTVM